MTFDPEVLNETLKAVRARLLEERNKDGYWEGRLSTSALATAVASFALNLAEEPEPATRGLRWLVENANEDGGWGDSPESPSNLTATLLSWCALSHAKERDAACDEVIAAAEKWITNRAGGLEPERIREAVLSFYGNDRTFSAPILTMCTLAGKMGGDEAWKQVPQLPFELAVFPHQCFKWLRLPVVSYALPALIAIGLVRHRHRPCWVLWRNVRERCVPKVLDVLRRIQPASGGFLEAAPLTSFVAMSMVAAGYGEHEATRACLRFLVEGQCEDGGWPIDTNLATWLTSLSTRALAEGGLPDNVGLDARCYLLNNQLKEEHPFTHAAPGGWAWTWLTGGVPDADDTSGALVALHNIGGINESMRRAAAIGIGWLLALQNRDGGLPTFCRGWGKLPFDRSCPDITAHGLHAFALWRDQLDLHFALEMKGGIHRGLRYLARSQRDDGAWIPLWFGNQHVPRQENPTFGTARVVSALRYLLPKHTPGTPQTAHKARSLRISARAERKATRMLTRGRDWLVAAQNEDGGWGGDKGAPSTIEETAIAVHALAGLADDAVVARGATWLIENTEKGAVFPAAPIGLYFASLWYSEKLYPIIFTADALTAAKSCLKKD